MKIDKKSYELGVDDGKAQGGGGEPDAYLKSITKDTTNKTVTIKDKEDTETTFEYGGSGEPSSYLKSVTKDTTNKTITIKDKEDTETTFEYGGGEEPSAYLKSIDKTNNVITIKDKEDNETSFELDTLPKGNTLPSGEYEGQIFIYSGTEIDKGIYRYNGSSWDHIANWSTGDIVTEDEITDDDSKIPNSKAIFKYIASGNFGNPRHIDEDTPGGVNYIADTGFYDVDDNVSSCPVSLKGGYMLVIRKTTSTEQMYYRDYMQIFYCTFDSTLWTRQLIDNTWRDWKRVAGVDDIPDVSGYVEHKNLGSTATPISLDNMLAQCEVGQTIMGNAVISNGPSANYPCSYILNNFAQGSANIMVTSLLDKEVYVTTYVVDSWKSWTNLADKYTKTETTNLLKGKVDIVNSSMDGSSYATRVDLINDWHTKGKLTGTFYGTFTTASENPTGSTSFNDRFVHTINIVNGKNYAEFFAMHRETNVIYTCTGAKGSGDVWTFTDWQKLNAIITSSVNFADRADLYNKYSNGVYEFISASFTSGGPTGSASHLFHTRFFRQNNYCKIWCTFGATGVTYTCYRTDGTNFSNWVIEPPHTYQHNINLRLGVGTKKLLCQITNNSATAFTIDTFESYMKANFSKSVGLMGNWQGLMATGMCGNTQRIIQICAWNTDDEKFAVGYVDTGTAGTAGLTIEKYTKTTEYTLTEDKVIQIN